MFCIAFVCQFMLLLLDILVVRLDWECRLRFAVLIRCCRRFFAVFRLCFDDMMLRRYYYYVHQALLALLPAIHDFLLVNNKRKHKRQAKWVLISFSLCSFAPILSSSAVGVYISRINTSFANAATWYILCWWSFYLSIQLDIKMTQFFFVLLPFEIDFALVDVCSVLSSLNGRFFILNISSVCSFFLHLLLISIRNAQLNKY